jgi:hypothetical protein
MEFTASSWSRKAKKKKREPHKNIKMPWNP